MIAILIPALMNRFCFSLFRGGKLNFPFLLAVRGIRSGIAMSLQRVGSFVVWIACGFMSNEHTDTVI